MLICHCLTVNDQTIADLARGEALTVDEVMARCGAGGDCGDCRTSIQWVLDGLLSGD